jgi:hypothetical protein
VQLPEVSPQGLQNMLNHFEYQGLLVHLSGAQRVRTARALRVFERSGLTPRQSAALYRQFDSSFRAVSSKAAGDDELVEAYLAHFIRQKQRAGLPDQTIRRRIDEAFAGCR